MSAGPLLQIEKDGSRWKVVVSPKFILLAALMVGAVLVLSGKLDAAALLEFARRLRP